MLKNLLPLFSTALFYLLYYLISTFKFDVQIATSAIFYDFLLQLGVGYILYALSKRVWIFLAIQERRRRSHYTAPHCTLNLPE